MIVKPQKTQRKWSNYWEINLQLKPLIAETRNSLDVGIRWEKIFRVVDLRPIYSNKPNLFLNCSIYMKFGTEIVSWLD